MNPKSFSSNSFFVHSLCQWVTAKLVSALLMYALPAILFSTWRKCLNLFYLHCRLIAAITWTPLNDLQKLSDYMIYTDELHCSES